MASSEFYVQGHPGGTFPSAMATGGSPMIVSVVGQRMGRLSRSCAICEGSSMLRVESTEDSSTPTARLCKLPAPLQVGQTTIKRGPDPTRSGRSKSCFRVRSGRVLHQDPPAYRPAGPSGLGGAYGRAAPRDDLLYDLMDQVALPTRAAQKAPAGGCWRPGLRCRLDPTVVLRSKHRVGDSSRTSKGTGSPTDL
jgi:hypothetical protein